MTHETAALSGAFARLSQYFAELHGFGERLSELAQRFQAMARAGRFPERGAAFRYDPKDPRHPLHRAIDITRQAEFLIAVTGAFSSGKSTLLNVLLGQPELLPSSAIPLTAVCTAIRWGERPRLELGYAPLAEALARVREGIEGPWKKELASSEQLEEAAERPEAFLEAPASREALRRFARLLLDFPRLTRRQPSFEERAPFIAGGGVLPVSTAGGPRLRWFLPTPAQEAEYLAAGGDPALWVSREWLALLREVNLWVDAPLLRQGIVFLDLPGLNCREDYHRRAIREHCRLADAVVVTAFQPGNQADEEIVRGFKSLSSNFRDKLFFVFNRIDQFQTEPEELERAFDYLSQDCIGANVPRERCFLTSAFLARERQAGSPRFAGHFESFRAAFAGFQSRLPGLAALVEEACAGDDPGGLCRLRAALERFLAEDAWPAKIRDILGSFESMLASLRTSASPRYEDVLRLDPRELIQRALAEWFQRIERLARGAVYAFRYEYLRGPKADGRGLAADLKAALERAHGEIQRRIGEHFNHPIQTAPPREDPVSEFDLRRIGDDASLELRRQFQEILAGAVVDAVRQRFYEHLNKVKLRHQLRELFAGAPEWSQRFEECLERFEFRLRHSFVCRVRPRFHAMPAGRDLKRLERSARLAELKPLLVKVFSEFYPDWIHHNVYGEILDELWLSFFLDAEELEHELRRFFDSGRGALATAPVLDGARIPEELGDGLGDLPEVAALCRRIDELSREHDELAARGLRAPALVEA